MIANKQRDIVKLFEQYESEGRRIPRDSISISLEEIFEVCEDSDLNILVKGVKITKSELMNMFEAEKITL